MKKILSLILAVSIILTFAGCAANTDETAIDDAIIDTNEVNSSVTSDALTDEQEETEVDADESTDKQPNEQKPNQQKPDQQKPAQQDTPAQTPPVSSAPQEEKPSLPEQDKPTETSLGNTLLSLFNSKASSDMSALSIAEALVTSPSISFSGMAMPVEEGLLSGFDNNEIKGFKSGAMFAPMIGSIPFVGYVFELENGADAASFISNLRKSANLRWNICVEAEEMVTGSKGNKVFFVMCPKSLEE